MNTTYFHDCKDESEIKALYRDLAKQHHPDLGGSEETMKEINAEYEARMTGVYESKDNATEDNVKFWTEREAEMIERLRDLVLIPGITIEIIGVWVWITGDTKPVKETLKECKCRWSRDKKAWYWRSQAHKWTGHRKNAPKKDLDGLRSTWGSSSFSGSRKSTPALA